MKLIFPKSFQSKCAYYEYYMGWNLNKNIYMNILKKETFWQAIQKITSYVKTLYMKENLLDLYDKSTHQQIFQIILSHYKKIL